MESKNNNFKHTWKTKAGRWFFRDYYLFSHVKMLIRFNCGDSFLNFHILSC